METAASSLRDLRVAEVTKMDLKVDNGKGHRLPHPRGALVQIRDMISSLPRGIARRKPSEITARTAPRIEEKTAPTVPVRAVGLLSVLLTGLGDRWNGRGKVLRVHDRPQRNLGVECGNHGSAIAGICDESFMSNTMEPDRWPLSSGKK